MAKIDLINFYEFVHNDRLLRERFRAIAELLNKEDVSQEEVLHVKRKIVNLGRLYGFYFTEEELSKSLLEVKVFNSSYPLTLEELEQVSGGVSRRTAALTLSAVTMAGLGVFAAQHLINNDTSHVRTVSQGSDNKEKSAPQEKSERPAGAEEAATPKPSSDDFGVGTGGFGRERNSGRPGMAPRGIDGRRGFTINDDFAGRKRVPGGRMARPNRPGAFRGRTNKTQEQYDKELERFLAELFKKSPDRGPGGPGRAPGPKAPRPPKPPKGGGAGGPSGFSGSQGPRRPGNGPDGFGEADRPGEFSGSQGPKRPGDGPNRFGGSVTPGGFSGTQGPRKPGDGPDGFGGAVTPGGFSGTQGPRKPGDGPDGFGGAGRPDGFSGTQDPKRPGNGPAGFGEADRPGEFRGSQGPKRPANGTEVSTPSSNDEMQKSQMLHSSSDKTAKSNKTANDLQASNANKSAENSRQEARLQDNAQKLPDENIEVKIDFETADYATTGENVKLEVADKYKKDTTRAAINKESEKMHIKDETRSKQKTGLQDNAQKLSDENIEVKIDFETEVGATNENVTSEIVEEPEKDKTKETIKKETEKMQYKAEDFKKVAPTKDIQNQQKKILSRQSNKKSNYNAPSYDIGAEQPGLDWLMKQPPVQKHQSNKTESSNTLISGIKREVLETANRDITGTNPAPAINQEVVVVTENNGVRPTAREKRLEELRKGKSEREQLEQQRKAEEERVCEQEEAARKAEIKKEQQAKQRHNKEMKTAKEDRRQQWAREQLEQQRTAEEERLREQEEAARKAEIKKEQQAKQQHNKEMKAEKEYRRKQWALEQLEQQRKAEEERVREQEAERKQQDKQINEQAMKNVTKAEHEKRIKEEQQQKIQKQERQEKKRLARQERDQKRSQDQEDALNDFLKEVERVEEQQRKAEEERDGIDINLDFETAAGTTIEKVRPEVVEKNEKDTTREAIKKETEKIQYKAEEFKRVAPTKDIQNRQKKISSRQSNKKLSYNAPSYDIGAEQPGLDWLMKQPPAQKHQSNKTESINTLISGIKKEMLETSKRDIIGANPAPAINQDVVIGPGGNGGKPPKNEQDVKPSENQLQPINATEQVGQAGTQTGLNAEQVTQYAIDETILSNLKKSFNLPKKIWNRVFKQENINGQSIYVIQKEALKKLVEDNQEAIRKIINSGKTNPEVANALRQMLQIAQPGNSAQAIGARENAQDIPDEAYGAMRNMFEKEETKAQTRDAIGTAAKKMAERLETRNQMKSIAKAAANRAELFNVELDDDLEEVKALQEKNKAKREKRSKEIDEIVREDEALRNMFELADGEAEKIRKQEEAERKQQDKQINEQAMKNVTKAEHEKRIKEEEQQKIQKQKRQEKKRLERQEKERKKVKDQEAALNEFLQLIQKEEEIPADKQAKQQHNKEIKAAKEDRRQQWAQEQLEQQRKAEEERLREQQEKQVNLSDQEVGGAGEPGGGEPPKEESRIAKPVINISDDVDSDDEEWEFTSGSSNDEQSEASISNADDYMQTNSSSTDSSERINSADSEKENNSQKSERNTTISFSSETSHKDDKKSSSTSTPDDFHVAEVDISEQENSDESSSVFSFSADDKKYEVKEKSPIISISATSEDKDESDTNKETSKSKTTTSTSKDTEERVGGMSSEEAAEKKKSNSSSQTSFKSSTNGSQMSFESGDTDDDVKEQIKETPIPDQRNENMSSSSYLDSDDDDKSINQAVTKAVKKEKSSSKSSSLSSSFDIGDE